MGFRGEGYLMEGYSATIINYGQTDIWIILYKQLVYQFHTMLFSLFLFIGGIFSLSIYFTSLLWDFFVYLFTLSARRREGRLSSFPRGTLVEGRSFFQNTQDLFYLVSKADLGSLSLRSRQLMFLATLMVSRRCWFSFSSSFISLSLENSSFENRWIRFRTNGLFSNPSQLGLYEGFVFKQRAMKDERSLEQQNGRFSQVPLLIFFHKSSIPFPWKGGLCEASQQITHPRDQTSHLLSYALLFHTSGEAQYGVPVWVQAIPFLDTIETLRSPSFTPSCPISTLAVFRSRWKMFILCRYLSPWMSLMAIFQISSSSMYLLDFFNDLIFPAKSPLAANSVMMQSDLVFSSISASLYPMMQGLLMLAKSLTSLRLLLTSFWFIWLSLILFRAYSLESLFLLTLKTEAKAPSPTRFRMSYSLSPLI